ncbi:septum formation initiator family protein [Enterovirga sp.]|jgi:cell division protein FtsB|uniref:septum formation initiator family protein n=1 Tax=Enterovirga sp. TaxID=2026350 RepID=UPI002628B6E9|nr:septum formation initiator family protein [Enterovirga sp.]MDB5591674.1 septation inhibitor protein [Enterovirga sp.]
MVVRRRFRAVLIPLVAYACAAGLVWYFLHNARIGNRGFDAKQVLKIQIFEVNRELAAARAERAEWDRRLALLQADQVDRDLLEERGRILLGRVHKNDVVIVGP